MNPLAFTKLAGRLLMALAAISGIFFSAGCGSSSSTSPNQGGFTNSNLNGTYVFTSNGADLDGTPLAIAGVFTSTGSSISGGTIDIVDYEDGVPSPVAQPITSANYTVGTDGRGRVNLTSSYGTLTLYFVLTTTSGGISSHGTVVEFDTNGTGTGTLDLQASTTSLAGNYAFSVAGADGNESSFASAGAFAVDGTGNVTGVQDFNDNDTPALNQSISGLATAGTGTTPGSISIDTSSFSQTYDVYPIDSTHWKIIETDGDQFLAGDAFSQTSTTIPAETLAFTMGGGVASTIANAGTITSDGSDNFTGLYDVNNGGTVVTGLSFSGSGSTGSVGGRTIVNVDNFNPSTQLALYPSSAGLLMLETDGNNVTSGIGFVQSGGSVAASQGYGFNLAGFNTDGDYQESENAQFTTNTSGGFSGIIDINDDDGQEEESLDANQPLTGTYTASGNTGSVTTTIGSNAFISFNYYAVDSSNFLVLETDSNQIGSGSFQLQNSATANVARHALVSIVHPRPGAAKKAHNAKAKHTR